MNEDSRSIILKSLKAAACTEFAQPQRSAEEDSGIQAMALKAFSSSELFADYLQEGEDLPSQFARVFTSLKGEIFMASDSDEAGRILLMVLNQIEGSVTLQSHPQLEEIIDADAALKQRLRERVHASISSPELARASVGVSLADALCARTGSILIRSHTAGGRRLSVLPAVHIVLAKESQVVPTLSPWLSAIVQDDAWSTATIISGPSRTADIEKILVLGAHGPKRVIVILYEDSR